MSSSALTKRDIQRLLKLLNTELWKENTIGELYLVGGAVMSLMFDARDTTKDIDSIFKPEKTFRMIAKRIAMRENLPEDWLNDAVKGFLSSQSEFEPYLELKYLRVFCASPRYLLAMKCLAMRLGFEFHDLEDVRYLMRYLNLSKYEDACEVLKQYYPLDQYPQKALYAIEEILEKIERKAVRNYRIS